MRAYYIDLGYKDVRRGQYEKFVFDEDGIPQYRYSNGLFYNITFICHYALYHYTLFMKYQRSKNLKRFIQVSDWILSHGEETNDSFIFYYKFHWGDLKPPWISALGQGRLLSVLSRAFEATKEERYLRAAKKALHPLKIPAGQGGLLTSFPDGKIAFAEYPTQQCNIVLNGLITCLVGIYDIASIGKDQKTEYFFHKALKGLEENLSRYDLGYWSQYKLSGIIPHIADTHYHNYHIMQLWALYEMTGREIFREYSEKWDRYSGGMHVKMLRFLCQILHWSWKRFK